MGGNIISAYQDISLATGQMLVLNQLDCVKSCVMSSTGVGNMEAVSMCYPARRDRVARRDGGSSGVRCMHPEYKDEDSGASASVQVLSAMGKIERTITGYKRSADILRNEPKKGSESCMTQPNQVWGNHIKRSSNMIGGEVGKRKRGRGIMQIKAFNHLL